MEAYGKRYGFMIIKKRLAQFDINRHRDCKSKRQQCPWNANFNCPQNFQVVSFTTFNNLHNYALFPTDPEYYSSKYCCISNDVLKEVQFLTEHGNLLITTQQKSLYGLS
ncbi:unnamed protein product [Rhizophagus irregularis]|nr:unnamed protein product [Rhizophagus irregularis]